MTGTKLNSALKSFRNPKSTQPDQHPLNHHHRQSSNSANVSTSSPIATATTSSSLTRLAVCLVVLLALLEATSAQNVHFSNGWYPGKKRSSPSISSAAAAPLMAAAAAASSPSSSSSGAFSACSVRPDLGEIINKIIMEEILRLHSTCLFGVPRDLRDILETAASKQTKW